MDKKVLNGMGENETDMKSIGLESATLAALLDKFVLQDGKQENSALAVASAFVPEVRFTINRD